ncbi:unnamed protein product, partial [Rotaria socialis]
MDQYTNDDSTSNQSDSSSSSTTVMSRQQQVIHGNTTGVARPSGIQSVQYEALMSRDEQEQTTKTSVITTKRALITKNIGTTE